jgi:hypothetical protein
MARTANTPLDHKDVPRNIGERKLTQYNPMTYTARLSRYHKAVAVLYEKTEKGRTRSRVVGG